MASETVGYTVIAKGIDREDNPVSIRLAVLVGGDDSDKPTYLERLFIQPADAVRAVATHFNVNPDNLRIVEMQNRICDLDGSSINASILDSPSPD